MHKQNASILETYPTEISIAQHMRMDFYLDNHQLFKEGHRGNKLYFLHKGLVVIHQGEKEDVLATMLPVGLHFFY